MDRARKTVVIASVGALLVATAVFAASSSSLEFDVGINVTSPVSAIVQWAIPEGRVGASSTNWDTDFYLTVRTAAEGDSTILDFMPDLASTTVGGVYLTPIVFSNIASGTYDVCIKGKQHLSRKLNDIAIIESGVNTLNFTQADNSATTGSIRLLAGDIDGAGNSTTTLGDDVINSVDLSLLLQRLDEDDPTGNNIRANLNQDSVVNSVDMSLMIKNLDLEGDR